MMAEKEGGVIQGAEFGSLWDVSVDLDGNERYWTNNSDRLYD